MDLKETIRSIPDWPIKGVIFRDLTTLMQNPLAFKKSCDILYDRYKDMSIDKIVGIDARGFVFGAVLAYKLGIGFIPVRKKGKLPWKTIQETYSLEYGEDTLEIHEDAVEKGEKVVIVDDLIATGGTVGATVKLVKKLEAQIIECAFIVELPELKGRDQIQDCKVFVITEFEGE
ncbi:MAG: adenine phosphoribosyltransferase [Desulfobacula sp.]|jgi:adenine phosphoribosyltransferase|uniref:adenine phosphoribosyltransferase n=1 Tax=Desulfobacula sp. TaxID=2593537 RepID=UPI001D6AE0BC|nr:adenine phosphoribosyltransferase [Desulfobacula sp.]MBT3484757.1 adenine phosphoribosyltransferase [Desulfobacula sp.]MBT3804387.1 adenine phosphoribosyltransferase [Desulfobacula sp.]MBT4025178.1 adenine phosphoribosyltransferase [Desulfobacula sp.]MBT4198580.1 adenine phosphoribosyltransferase [Desulfobacula sp.]